MVASKANLGFVKLIVEDLDRAAAFYSAVCGVNEVGRVDDEMNGRPMSEVILEPAQEGASALVIMTYRDGSTPSHGQAVPVFFTDDLDAFVARVEQNGGKVSQLREMPDQRARVAFWYDPEGNLIETAQMLGEAA